MAISKLTKAAAALAFIEQALGEQEFSCAEKLAKLSNMSDKNFEVRCGNNYNYHVTQYNKTFVAVDCVASCNPGYAWPDRETPANDEFRCEDIRSGRWDVDQLAKTNCLKEASCKMGSGVCEVQCDGELCEVKATKEWTNTLVFSHRKTCDVVTGSDVFGRFEGNAADDKVRVFEYVHNHYPRSSAMLGRNLICHKRSHAQYDKVVGWINFDRVVCESGEKCEFTESGLYHLSVKEFKITLETNMGYEVDSLSTDNGYAKFKNLPIGEYTIYQYTDKETKKRIGTLKVVRFHRYQRFHCYVGGMCKVALQQNRGVSGVNTADEKMKLVNRNCDEVPVLTSTYHDAVLSVDLANDSIRGGTYRICEDDVEVGQLTVKPRSQAMVLP